MSTSARTPGPPRTPARNESANRVAPASHEALIQEECAVLPVPAEASGAMVTYTAREFPLAKATLTARYGR